MTSLPSVWKQRNRSATVSSGLGWNVQLTNRNCAAHARARARHARRQPAALIVVPATRLPGAPARRRVARRSVDRPDSTSRPSLPHLKLQLFAEKVRHRLEARRRGQLEFRLLQLRRVAGRLEEHDHWRAQTFVGRPQSAAVARAPRPPNPCRPSSARLAAPTRAHTHQRRPQNARRRPTDRSGAARLAAFVVGGGVGPGGHHARSVAFSLHTSSTPTAPTATDAASSARALELAPPTLPGPARRVGHVSRSVGRSVGRRTHRARRECRRRRSATRLGTACARAESDSRTNDDGRRPRT